MANPWESDPVVSGAKSGGNPWDNDPVVASGAQNGRDEIVGQYANEILRRNAIYRTIPQEQIADPARLYKLAELEAQRNGYKPVEGMAKQDKLSSFAMNYGQGGTFAIADELSGAVDFVGGAAMGLARGEGLGAIDSGKQAYSDRVEADRRLQRQAEIDNPVTSLAGNLAGGIITYAPAPAGWMGAGARTTGQVAAQAATKAQKLEQLSKTGAGFLRASRADRAANLSAKAATLSRPAANVGEQAARFGGRVAESVGKGIGYGAGYGGLYGLGSAEGGLGERLDDAAQGAAFGAVGGAVLTPAMQFVVAPIVGKAGYSLFTSLDNKALDKVLQRAERSGTSLQDVRADFDTWKKTGEVPETLAELMGPHERSLLSAMITVNRETEERAGSTLLGRGKKEVDRLEKSFARAMGAERGDFARARAGAQKARREDPESFYQAAHFEPSGQRRFLDEKQTQAVTYEISKSRVAQGTLSTAIDYADAKGLYAVRDEIEDFARALAAGKSPQKLSVEAADYIERGINNRYKAALKGGTQDIPSGIKSLRDRLRGVIDSTGLGDARATAAERIRRGELLDEGRKFLEKGVDIEDITDTLRGNPDLGIDPASPAGQQAYTVGAARAIGDKLRETQNMKGFADATRAVARTPAIREKVNAVLPQGKLTKKGVPNKGSRQSKLNRQLEADIERTADRADFTNTMLGNSRTAFRQGAVQDALADDSVSTAIGDGVRDLLIGGPGNLFQQAVGKFAKGAGARIGQPGIMRPGLNRKMADILLATDKEIPVQVARLVARARQRAQGGLRANPAVAGAAGATSPRGRTPPSGGSPAGPIRAGGFAGFGKKPLMTAEERAAADGKLTDAFAGGTPPARTPRDVEIERLSQAERDALAQLDDLNNQVIDMGVDPAILQERRLLPSDVSANAWPRVQEIQQQMDDAATRLMRARDEVASLRNAPEGDAFGRGGSREAPANALNNPAGPIRGAGFMGFGGGKKPPQNPSQAELAKDLPKIRNSSKVNETTQRRWDLAMRAARQELRVAPPLRTVGPDGVPKATEAEVEKLAIDIAATMGILDPAPFLKHADTAAQVIPMRPRQPRSSGLGALRNEAGQQVLAGGFGSIAGSTQDLNDDGKIDWQDSAWGAVGALGAVNAPRVVGAARNALANGARRTVGARNALADTATTGLGVRPAARFETPGSPEWEAAKAKGLDMSQAGRMARKKEMGFDKDGFHATDRDIEAFDSSLQELGTHIGTKSAAGHRVKTAGLKDGATIMPLTFRGKYVGVPDLGDFSSPFKYLAARARPEDGLFNAPRAFLRDLDKAAKEIENSRMWQGQELSMASKPWGETVRRIAKQHGIDGFRYLNKHEGVGAVSHVIFDPANIRSVNAAFDPDKAASPILTAGIGGGGRGPRKPSGGGNRSAELGKRAADLAAIGTLANAPPAQAQTADYTAEITAAKERANQIEKQAIPQLEADLRMLEDPAGDPFKLQELLQRRGDYEGKIDGKIGPLTRQAIADNAKRVRQEIETQRDELKLAREAVKQAEIRAAQARAEPSASGDILNKAAWGASFLAGGYLAYRMRNSAALKSIPAAQTATRKANALLNPKPLSRAKTGPDSLNARAGNINDFWRQGGAKRQVPFEADDTGAWRARPNARQPSEIFGRAPRFRGNDIGFMATAAIDAGASRLAINHFDKEIQEADADIEKYTASGDIAGLERALSRKKTAKGAKLAAEVMERLGYGYIAGRGAGALKAPYARIAPNMAKAEAERALLLQAMSRQPKPRKPPAQKQGQGNP